MFDFVSRSLFAVRSQYGMLDGGVRIHVISSLIRETINCAKSMLAMNMGSEDVSDFGSKSKEGNSVLNFIQKDRLLGAVRSLSTLFFSIASCCVYTEWILVRCI